MTDSENGRHVSADRDQTAMTEGNLSTEAVDDIQPDGRQCVDRGQ